ncbi:M28 family peptidase [Clostridium sp. YIM B02505]|uniref:M28 family peptidase n=1 Tax=Clostridium yunnanense TaxID=2800325 RepID=A0ABS1ESQ5_9CLOT|nr:M28 family peptidase [Clostridium yunnanense]MBK1812323.1 M28 family peptidase [Clostridium yunnanense]
MRKNFKSLIPAFIYTAIIVFFIYKITISSFSNQAFSKDNVYKNIEELSSEKFSGRQAGTEVNNKALEYVKNYFETIGIAPAGENGTYYQSFNTMMPTYNSNPVLSVLDKNTNETTSFKYGEDFVDILNGIGGSGNISGDLYFFDGSIKEVPKNMINGTVLVALGKISDEDLEYAADNHCKAMLILSNNMNTKDSFNIHSKNGKSLIIYKISANTAQFLFDHAQHNLTVSLTLDVSFKNINTPNLLGKIDGKNKSSGYLLVTADIDGVGQIGSSTFVPGSLHNASGVGMLMELANTMNNSKNKPDKTIIFALFNSHEEGNLGSRYYIENPLYPLDKSEVISLDSLGSTIDNKLYLSSKGAAGEALMSNLASYIPRDDFSVILKKNIHGGDTEAFLKKDVPAVLIYGDSTYDISNSPNSNNSTLGSTIQNQGFIHSTNDNLSIINKDRLNGIGKILTNYFQREVYNDWSHGVLNTAQYITILILAISSLVLLVPKTLYKIKPSGRILGARFESIYLSRIFNIIDKAVKISIGFLIIIFIILFIIFIPTSFNIVAFNEGYISNYSVFIIVQNVLNYIAHFPSAGFGKTLNHFDVFPVIAFSIGKSILLIVSSLILAFLVGTLSGTLTGFNKKKNAVLGVLSTLAIMSLPDVLIALIFQLIRISIYKNSSLSFLSIEGESQNFLYAFLSLAIIPTAYIARISQTAANEEMQKDYIIAAKAKGLSNVQIIKNHLLKSVSIKVVEALPSVLNIIISNLIIIEYFFNYHGIVYQIFSFYKDGDINATIGLIIGMALVYCILSIIIKTLSKLINTEKRYNSLRQSM